MKRRAFIQSVAAGAVTLIGIRPKISFGAEAAGSLESAFREPPPGAHCKTWWHWMNGNITAEGITLDLEAMKRVGIRGFQIFQVGTGIPKGPVDYSSSEHTRLLHHAAKEAERLGMEFDIMNCPGWSSSGGPWITPELSMKQFTWSEALVRGGQRVGTYLKQPLTKLGYYRDAYVLAFPALEGETHAWEDTLQRASTNAGAVDRGVLIYADRRIGVELRPAPDKPAFLLLEFSEPFEARSLAAYGVPINDAPPPSHEHEQTPLWLEVSDDGVDFRKVSDLDFGDSGDESVEFPETASFAAVRAKFYRMLTWHAARITDLRLSGAARLPHWTKKANFTRTPGYGPDTVEVPRGSIIDPSKVVDITQHLDSEDRLTWDAPEGTWMVLRIGQTTTGVQNHPAPDGGWGLECDKYSREAYDYHFDHFFGELLEALGPLAAQGLAGGVIDSYETGMQNWTREFPQEFSKRRGYDLVKYLPTMTGRVVESAEVSERFLWDLRRTCADLMGDYYYGRFAERCRENKLKAYAEPYSGGPFDELQSGSHLDVPMGEFWVGQGNNNYSVKLAGSIGHLFGKPVVGCESFTGDEVFAKWQNYPYQMKGQGDLMYTQGLNQYIFHRNAMQPHPPTALPGMTMGPWGWENDRTNTLYDSLTGWYSYAARAQNVLRQGTLVADLIYYIGVEVPVDTPVYPEQLKPTPPEGFYYDIANEGAILDRMKAENGAMVFPDGLRYRVLVLPEDARLNLDVLRKVRDMVREGIAVVGPKPQANPGLTQYPASDSELRQIAEEVWGDLDGKSVTHRTCGKGQVFWGLPMAAVLEKLGIKPDCAITSRSGDAAINFMHRRAEGAEVYFVANLRRRAEDVVCTFRVQGKQLELWNPETGEITNLGIFDTSDAGTRVALNLSPAQSVFVVFRSPAAGRHIRSIVKDGKPIAASNPFPAFKAGNQREVTNDFTVSVWIKPDLDSYQTAKGDKNTDVPNRSLVLSPPQGDAVYGSGHVSCGLLAGRNLVAVLERDRAIWRTVFSTPIAISGWAHVALVYKAGAPSVYVDGKLIGQSEASGAVVHPGVHDASERDGAEYFDGDMSEPELFKEALGEDRIRELAAKPSPGPIEPSAVEWPGGANSELLFWQDGSYTLEGQGKSTVKISGIGKPLDVAGPWQVSFPPNLGAPPEVTLPELISLHKHSEPGVKYFSGTATYSKQLTLSPGAPSGERRLYLDLGWVHALAQVRLNDKDLGLLWKPPFRIDITAAARRGDNKLEVLVTNQWVNRLIGDEQLPPDNEYGPDGAIKAIPKWFTEGKPKPPSARVTFATWKHFTKDTPLLISGLIGPVRLRTAIRRQINP